DNNWFKTLTKPNVELVTDKIDRFAANGIVTADGTTRQHEIIVISTGFKVSEMAARLNITGREGKNLKQVWSHDNPTAYLGLTVPDFPNLF
ncbi:4-hydroxyacetophenone monooxygenase, partial [Acinetobacter baumannii]